MSAVVGVFLTFAAYEVGSYWLWAAGLMLLIKQMCKGWERP